MLSTYRSVFRDLCGVQRDLAVKVELIDNMGFTRTWQSASKATRQEHMLEGHVRACRFLTTDMSRIHSVDITLESLEKDNGAGLLSLLKTYTLADSSCFPETPLSFPYPGSTSLRPTSNPQIKLAREMCVVLRDQYLCKCQAIIRQNALLTSPDLAGYLLLFTIMSYYGAPMPTVPPLAKTPFRRTVDDDTVQVEKQLFGKDPLKQERDGKNPLVKACESCEQPEADSPLRQCAGCNNVTLSRRTWYCSK